MCSVRTRSDTRAAVGLGGLCWHNCEHNRTLEHKGIIEHNGGKNMSMFTKILTLYFTFTFMFCTPAAGLLGASNRKR